MSLLRMLGVSQRKADRRRTKGTFHRPRAMVETLEDRTLLSVSAITHDLFGDLYVAGAFSGQTSFNTNAGQTILTASGTQDVYLTKYDPSGNLLWAESLPGSSTATATPSAIVIDGAGNLVVTGSFQGTVDFDGGAGQTLLTSKGSTDIFTAKYSPAGALQWAHRAGGSSQDAGLGLTVDAAGNVYTTGRFGGKAYLNPASGTTILSSHGSSDAFVWKLTATGNYVWAKDIGGSSTTVGNALTLDATGHLYVAGAFKGTDDFDPGSGTVSIASHGGADAFVLKLDNNGVFQWVKTFGGGHDDAATGVAVDGTGRLDVTGTFKSKFDLISGLASSAISSGGDTDVFIAQFDPTGKFTWDRTFGGSGTEQSTGLGVDALGDIYVTGSFQMTARYSTGSTTIASSGGNDVFLLKVNSSGNLLWQQGAGSPSDDAAAGITVDAAGNAEVTGSFSGTIQFGVPSRLSLSTTATQSNYLWWLDPTGNSLQAQSFADTGSTGSGSTGSGSTGSGSTGSSGSAGSLILNSSLPPSGNFNLSTWNLTLPTGKSGSPTVIPTTTLDTGYTSQYFYTGSDGAMVFWCPVTGVTTSGTKYPRTELRETKSDGSLYNWNVMDGTATLNGTLAVNQVPSSGKVIVGQIHDNGAGGISDQPLIKLVYEFNSSSGTGTLVAQVRSTPTSTGSTDYTVATGIKLNTQFSYQIQLLKTLTLSVQINGTTKYNKPVDPSWKTQGMYFKAGAYVQDNVGPSTEGGRVSFYGLTISHT
jgi:hypothetical protein